MYLKTVVLAICLSLTYSAYVASVSRELAYYAVAVYESPATIQNWSCPECSSYTLNNVALFQYTPTNLLGFVGYSPKLKAIVVSFRGTMLSDLSNAIIDITLGQTTYPDVQVVMST
jgi:hypothetical protein